MIATLLGIRFHRSYASKSVDTTPHVGLQRRIGVKLLTLSSGDTAAVRASAPACSYLAANYDRKLIRDRLDEKDRIHRQRLERYKHKAAKFEQYNAEALNDYHTRDENLRQTATTAPVKPMPPRDSLSNKERTHRYISRRYAPDLRW